jgi:hypothetical protein
MAFATNLFTKLSKQARFADAWLPEDYYDLSVALAHPLPPAQQNA